MKLLLTGYPGFLAASIKEWFESNGWEVDTLGLLPFPQGVSSSGVHIICNLVDETPQLPKKNYDLVIHAAGKAHVVPKNEAERKSFFDVNVTGTQHILDALQVYPPRSIVFISSVAVYGKETGDLIKEDAPLLAETPYGKSKIQAEELIRNTPFSKEVIRGIVRLPLIAGKDAPGNLGSMINAIKKGIYFNVAGGKAVRSVVLKNDIAPFLNELGKHGGTYNFTDGRGITYKELDQKIHALVPCPKRPGLPYWLAWLMALCGEVLSFVFRRPMPIDFYRLDKLVNNLTFDSSKAAKDIPFSPRCVIDHINEIL